MEKKNLFMFMMTTVALLSLLCGTVYAYDTEKEIESPGASFTVPAYFPQETVEGDQNNGSVTMVQKNEGGIYEQLFKVAWSSDKALSTDDLFKSDSYTVSAETPKAVPVNLVVNGHTASYKEFKVAVKRPCGHISAGKLIVVKFNCDKGNKHYMLAQFVDQGIEQSDVVSVAKSIKCHE